MFATPTMLDATRRPLPRLEPTQVAHWAFDRHAGQIHGHDQQGRVLLAIATGPQFGHRLAAAFDRRLQAGAANSLPA